MSVYDGMARDAGYTGDEAAQVARILEERHRDEAEQQDLEERAALAAEEPVRDRPCARRWYRCPPEGCHPPECWA